LFEIKVFGSIFGVTTLNRFWYHLNQVPNTMAAADLADAFDTHVRTQWAALVSDDWTADVIEVDEVTSETNFATKATGLFGGTKSGTTNMPPYEVFVIRLFRTSKETRSGWKRICGVSEEDQSGGQLETAVQTELANLAARFDSNFTLTGGTVNPVIVRKTYSLPPVEELQDPSLWIVNFISDAQGQVQLSTQNTRKFGRGI
jgi:hypothetical protein